MARKDWVVECSGGLTVIFLGVRADHDRIYHAARYNNLGAVHGAGRDIILDLNDDFAAHALDTHDHI